MFLPHGLHTCDDGLSGSLATSRSFVSSWWIPDSHRFPLVRATASVLFGPHKDASSIMTLMFVFAVGDAKKIVFTVNSRPQRRPRGEDRSFCGKHAKEGTQKGSMLSMTGELSDFFHHAPSSPSKRMRDDDSASDSSSCCSPEPRSPNSPSHVYGSRSDDWAGELPPMPSLEPRGGEEKVNGSVQDNYFPQSLWMCVYDLDTVCNADFSFLSPAHIFSESASHASAQTGLVPSVYDSFGSPSTTDESKEADEYHPIHDFLRPLEPDPAMPYRTPRRRKKSRTRIRSHHPALVESCCETISEEMEDIEVIHLRVRPSTVGAPPFLAHSFDFSSHSSLLFSVTDTGK